MKANLASAQLKAYESVIEKGQETFVEVGEALAKIRDNRLFREAGYHSFDQYCQERWSMGKSYASRLISGAAVAKEFPIGNQGQATALRQVPEPQRAEVMARVQERGPVTAAAITKEATRHTPRQAEPVCTHCPVHCP